MPLLLTKGLPSMYWWSVGSTMPPARNSTRAMVKHWDSQLHWAPGARAQVPDPGATR